MSSFAPETKPSQPIHGHTSILLPSTEELFNLASNFAISGNLRIKNRIYEEFIAEHPDASRDDLLRVQINRADWQRRQGKIEIAQTMLEDIDLTYAKNAIVQIEYLQAFNQCLLRKATTDIGDLQKIKLLERAVLNQESLYELAAKENGLGADKLIYYLVGICEIRGALLTIKGAEKDPRIEAVHGLIEKTYMENRLQMPETKRQRVEYEIPFNKGIYYRQTGDYKTASELFARAWHHLEILQDQRVQTVVMMEYLFCKLNLGETEGDLLYSRLLKLFKNKADSNLLPADRIMMSEQIKKLLEL